ncbi:DUF4232 domain-containing protein [Streptomyces sp. NPDC017949]|uniref:DUF4232 domain-containing protein n=2 Tax=unclassified Streptomyces TaxID=2593676 RepID=UPI0037B91B38
MSVFRSAHTTTSMTRTPRRLVGAAVAVVAALALTACQDGTGLKDEGAAAVSTAPSAAPSANGATSTPQGAGSGAQGTPGAPDPAPAASAGGTGTGANGGVRTGTGPGNAKGPSEPAAEGKRVLCNGSNTTVTVQPVSRPLNHLLITVKNTGSKPCDLTYHPVLRFDEMQWAPAARKETQPQAVVSLAPGRSGYAAALLSAADGSGEGGTTGRRLTVAFQGMTPNSSGGASATPSLPAAGVHYDSSLTVGYWQQTVEDALGS